MWAHSELAPCEVPLHLRLSQNDTVQKKPPFETDPSACMMKRWHLTPRNAQACMRVLQATVPETSGHLHDLNHC